MKKSGIIVGVIIGLIAISFFGLEFFRGQELKNNLPEYKIEETSDAAMVAAMALAKEVNGKYHLSEGLSNSWFLPFDKSFVVLDDTPFEELKKHDFVAYVDGNKKVFHRLVEKTDEGWKAQGDNNANVDRTLVTKQNYVGKLVEPIETWKGALIKDESLLSIFK